MQIRNGAFEIFSPITHSDLFRASVFEFRILALVFTVVSAMGKMALWPAVLMLVLVHLLSVAR